MLFAKQHEVQILPKTIQRKGLRFVHWTLEQVSILQIFITFAIPFLSVVCCLFVCLFVSLFSPLLPPLPINPIFPLFSTSSRFFSPPHFSPAPLPAWEELGKSQRLLSSQRRKAFFFIIFFFFPFLSIFFLFPNLRGTRAAPAERGGRGCEWNGARAAH